MSNLNHVFEGRNLGWESEVKVSGTSTVEGHVRFLHPFTFGTDLKLSETICLDKHTINYVVTISLLIFSFVSKYLYYLL